MDPEVLGRRGLAGPVWYTPAVAPGSRLAFSHRAAYANLEVVEDGEAEVANVDAGAPPQEWPSSPHGVLYGLTERDWRALVAAEGGYRVSTVRVVTYGGGGGAGGGAGTGDGPPPPGTALSAAAFTSSPWSTMKAGSLPPRAAYLATLAAGARARGLDGAYTAWLSALAPAAVVPGRGLPPPYFETPGRDAVVVGGLVLAMGMLGMADDWLLYTTEAGWGLPSIEPSSIQAQVYLHLAGVPLSVQECSLSRSAPTGVTPSLEHRGELVDAPPSSPTAPADAAAAIIEYARAAGADLDAWLSPPQRAEAAAFACLARAGLEPASAFTTWCEPASYAAAKAAYGADLPFPLNALLPRSARKAAERRFAGQPRARVYGEAAAAVASLADRLAASPGPFFFGDRPCGLDALLYAHLAFHRAAPVAAPELKAALDARPRVGAFIDAVAARLASLGPPPPRGASASTDADWAARAEAAQAEWRRAGATGPRSGGGRRAGGSGRGASTTGAASQKSTSTASGLSVGAGNAVWLGAVGAIVTAYALLSGQYVEWALEDVVPFGEDEGGEE